MKTDLSNRLTELLGVEYPIIQEGMGPFQTVALAAAVSAAGGMGTVSIPGMTRPASEGAELLRSHINKVAELTDKPFAVNVPVGRDDTGTMLPVSEAYICAVIEARASDPTLAKQLRVLTTSAGFPGEFRDRISDSGLVHMHKVGSTRHAVKAEAAGVDAVIASGFEMGGHTHAMPMHTFVLVPNVTQAVSVPVVLSGGARDGRTLAAALALGAEGVAMGTRFVATEDNDWHPNVRERIVAAEEGDDTVAPGVYGPARVLDNAGVAYTRQVIADGSMSNDELNAWKDQALTRAQSEGDLENGLLPMGQVASGIDSLVKVGEFVPRMAEEALEILRRLARLGA
jgi:NAD(P)H-dependent flavin oxidoreductase YrpB (nitropropane dioxygenase family)